MIYKIIDRFINTPIQTQMRLASNLVKIKFINNIRIITIQFKNDHVSIVCSSSLDHCLEQGRVFQSKTALK